ncbi:metallophosphoesterase [candidate division WWE3 bacterium CG10_big_fil_rev_8_21_14_0_10_32_10]|uniref:Metallophosphoesterase n=1 Tax=candidate division WWE3 bacterium CG10_big_fil_rev_8_21_14_0_10_32_10 TaxID=1975090 RepID=A0A2H0RBD7_UNCKA|nr:MAG: metallophosphoesterase [candidate division WWE3 bacterium CG10_big_fil_rev_8_21_14_0_10_32_10]
MNILFLGDIVSRLGRQAVKEFLPQLRKEHNIDIVIANCENVTNGRGIKLEHYNDLISYGINGFTTGEHIYRDTEILKKIDELDIAVPLNFYSENPGKRELTINTGKNGEIKIVSLLGMTFMSELVKNPFHAIDSYLNNTLEKNNKAITLVDFHAEATSEKIAMANFIKDRATVLVGTHTHIQTADEQIFDRKMAYITDVGMCGSKNSVIGVKTDIILNRFNKGINTPFEWEKEGEYQVNAVMISIDTKNQIAKNINRISLSTW